MAHNVKHLNRFPLTSGRAEVLDEAYVSSGGIIGDRILVLRDTAVNPEQARNRVDQKRYRSLALVSATCHFGDSIDRVALQLPGDHRVMDIPIRSGEQPDAYVNEFDQLTPLLDVGDKTAGLFSGYLGKPGIRLGQKLPDWLTPSPGEAANRKVSALHIVTTATVRQLQNMGGTEEYGEERLRAGVVIETDEPAFSELGWIGGTLVIEGIPYQVDRPTPRCSVTGIDQETGQNKKDIPKLFRDLPTTDGETMIGVYAHPIMEPGALGYMTVGSEVFIHPAGRSPHATM